ncbi:MAG: nucleoside deaminase [Ruminococcus sp.]|nr:nucleoside deaminase [Ruminococcus sp.]
MLYNELPAHWQRIFALEWDSLCRGSKAIAAVITDSAGNIVSEGRNMICESVVPNPSTLHAETEAVRTLDVAKYPDKWSLTLHAALEPCIMCMGTIVMGGIRRIEIAAHDDYGGAVCLLDRFEFARRKGIEVVWLEDGLGDIQRGFQTIRELLYNTDEEKRGRMLRDFSQRYGRGVEAAQSIADGGFFAEGQPSDYTAAEIFDELSKRAGLWE